MADSDDTDRDMLQARFNDRMAKRQTALEEHVARLAGAFKAAVGNLPPKDDRPTGPVSWLLRNDDLERGLAVKDDLIDWLQTIYLLYSDAVPLPSCWFWHPDVIEELLWLRHAHAEAYDQQKGDWRRVGDWHDRYRPRVVERIKKAAGRCEVSEHCTGETRGGPPPAVPQVSTTDLLTEFWTRPDSATAQRPEPTEDELTEATARFQTT